MGQFKLSVSNSKLTGIRAELPPVGDQWSTRTPSTLSHIKGSQKAAPRDVIRGEQAEFIPTLEMGLVGLSAERRFLTEVELANRWLLSVKTLQRWRSICSGPVFAKFNSSIRYPMLGVDGILAYERRAMAQPERSVQHE